MSNLVPSWEQWRYCEACDYEWKPGEFDASCKGCGGYGRTGRRIPADENYGVCERCGRDLTGPGEAMDGKCECCE